MTPISSEFRMHSFGRKVETEFDQMRRLELLLESSGEHGRQEEKIGATQPATGGFRSSIVPNALVRNEISS